MSNYNVSFVFFVESENNDNKDALLYKLDAIKEVECVDVYDDGEDWNIECTATIECGAKKNIDNAIHKKLIKLLPNVCWDYHYIKGTDNGFYWQP
jgi:hypothetical protein